jgi:O-antigen/teichoic acid export membrane protein
LKQILLFLREKKNDSGLERKRLFLLTTLSTFFSKGVSFTLLLISVPLTLSYLGNTYFAISNTIISTLAMFNYLDFGIGIGVQNLLPFYIAESNKNKINQIISTAFYVLIVSCAIVLVVGVCIINFYDWESIFNLKDVVKVEEVRSALLTSLLLIGFAIPVTIIQRIHNAYQKAFINEWFITLGNVLSILCLFLVIKLSLSLPYVIFALQGTLVVSLVINFLAYYKDPSRYEISFKYVELKTFRILISTGFKYLVLLIFSVGLFSLDNFILLKFRSPNDVTNYLLGYRLISILNVPVLILSNSFLPAYNDAIARGDRKWVSNIILNAVKVISIISFVETILLLAYGHDIMSLWVKTKLGLSFKDYILFSLLLVFLNFNTFFSMIAISHRYLNRSLYFFTTGVLITVSAKFILVKYITTGYGAIILPTVIIMPLLFLAPLIYNVYKKDIKK